MQSVYRGSLCNEVVSNEVLIMPYPSLGCGLCTEVVFERWPLNNDFAHDMKDLTFSISGFHSTVTM